jgi:hypothetical protein
MNPYEKIVCRTLGVGLNEFRERADRQSGRLNLHACTIAHSSREANRQNAPVLLSVHDGEQIVGVSADAGARTRAALRAMRAAELGTRGRPPSASPSSTSSTRRSGVPGGTSAGSKHTRQGGPLTDFKLCPNCGAIRASERLHHAPLLRKSIGRTSSEPDRKCTTRLWTVRSTPEGRLYFPPNYFALNDSDQASVPAD